MFICLKFEIKNRITVDLRDADIEKYKYLIQIIPEQGSFIAWKKAKGLILKLEIPNSAKRTCNFINRKCRASKVKTLEIQNIDGSISDACEVVGDYDNKTIYKINKITKVDNFDDDITVDCTHGIHFFITRKEAELW